MCTLIRPNDRNKSNPLILFKDNTYHCNASYNKHKYWQCSKYATTKCKARLTTDEHSTVILRYNTDHNHQNHWKPEKVISDSAGSYISESKLKVEDAITEYNIKYPIQSIKNIPNFANIRRQAYRRRVSGRCKLPIDKKG